MPTLFKKEGEAISRQSKIFWKSLVFSSVISCILIFSVFFTLYVPQKKPDTASSELVSSDFDANQSDSFTVVCSLSQNDTASPYAYFLLGFNGPMGQISVTRFFPQTVLSQSNAKKIILSEEFDLKGAKGAVAALNEYFSLDIKRYICFTNSSLLGFFELFNPITINVPQNLSQVDREKDIYIKIDKGRQHLGGALLIDYIACTAWENGSSQILQQSAEAVGQFLSQNHSLFINNAEAEKYILSNTQSNISALDIEMRRPLISALFKNEDSILILAADGEFKNEETEFHLTRQSYNSIRSRYGVI